MDVPSSSRSYARSEGECRPAEGRPALRDMMPGDVAPNDGAVSSGGLRETED